VGTLDLFAEEDMAYVFRPVEAGIPTESHLVPGVWHGFDLACPDTAISRSFHENHLNALRAAFLQAAPSPAAH
jgi:acetyl esterase/lipase